jgi:alkanesulfonate monooxygenase SsuD/methylene tetrahydromethanopterin reductase-like flavin-dependent oxidoreductase (luciferase family)
VSTPPIAPPTDVVTVLPAGRTVYGIQLPVQSQSTIYAQPWEAGAGPDELATVALACEAAGFFYVGVCDHTFIPERLAGAMSTVWYDTIATLGWLAAVTTEIRAAKEFATVDALSHGRLICGVGAGHVVEEFEQMGPEFDHRGPATDEAIVGLAAGLSEEFPVLDGPRWKATGLGLKPRPVQVPRPPIWVGGSSPAALRRTARYADGWLPQSLGPNLDLLVELRRMREEFRDGAPLDIGGISAALHVGAQTARSELPPGTVSGSPEQVAEYLRPFRDAGVGQIQVRFPAGSVEELVDQVAAFGSDVAPLVDG